MRYTDYDSDASEQQSDDSDVSSAGPMRRSRSGQKSRARSSKVRTLNRWTTEEHDKLAYLVDKWGSEKNWAKVAEEMPGRTGKQCRERWLNHMKPGIIKGNWSQEEEFLLAQCHALVGSHWSKMTKRLPGRTENSIKNFWNATLRSKAPNKKRGMLWTYMQLHDPKSDDNTTALITAITRLHDSHELPPHLLSQLDAQMLDVRTWRAIHKAEKDYLENVGGELHFLALPHPSTACCSADMCTSAPDQQQAYTMAAVAESLDQSGSLDMAAIVSCDGSAGLGMSRYQPHIAAALLQPQLRHSSDGGQGCHSFNNQHQVALPDAASHLHHPAVMATAQGAVMGGGGGGADDAGTSAAHVEGRASSVSCYDSAAAAMQQAGQHHMHTLGDMCPGADHNSTMLVGSTSRGSCSGLVMTQAQHYDACSAMPAEQPMFGDCQESNSTKHTGSREHVQQLQSSAVATPGNNSSGHAGLALQLQSSGTGGAGEIDSAASAEHPFASHQQLLSDMPAVSGPLLASFGNRLVSKQAMSAGGPGARCDQGSSGNSTSTTVQRHCSTSTARIYDTKGDISHVDHSGAVAARRTAGSGSAVAGGHGPACSCGPCVNSRKLHGLHSPGARRQNRNASNNSTRFRSLNSLAVTSDTSCPPPAKLQRTQYLLPPSGAGVTASQRCVSMYNSHPALDSDRGVDDCASQSVLHADGAPMGANCTRAAGYHCNGLIGGVVEELGPSAGACAAGYMQQLPMLQQLRGESPFAQHETADWEGAGVLVAEPPAARATRPYVGTPQAVTAAEIPDGLPKQQQLQQEQQQQQQQQLQQQQQQQQQQEQQLSVLEPMTSNRAVALEPMPGTRSVHLQQQQLAGTVTGTQVQLQELPYMPGLPNFHAPAGGGSSQQPGLRGTQQQGLDLSLALASPIGLRLGMPGISGSLEGLGAIDQLHRVSVGQDLGLCVPHSCRQGVRLPSFGQIIMQRASASALDWDWEALLMTDNANRMTRPSETGEGAANIGVAGLPLSGLKRTRVSLTSIDDDAALLIDMKPTTRIVRGNDTSASGSLYGCCNSWIPGDF